MLRTLNGWIEKRRAQSFINNIRAWHQLVFVLVDLMDNALYDQAIIQSDIGYIVECYDLVLSQMRCFSPGIRRTLLHNNRTLANRYDEICLKIGRLRNETRIFLIRSQGPCPEFGQKTIDESRISDYYQALSEVGFDARQLKGDLNLEIKTFWQDVQPIIKKVETTLNRESKLNEPSPQVLGSGPIKTISHAFFIRSYKRHPD